MVEFMTLHCSGLKTEGFINGKFNIYLIIFLHTVCRLRDADMSIHCSKHWNIMGNIYIEGDLNFQ